MPRFLKNFFRYVISSTIIFLLYPQSVFCFNPIMMCQPAYLTHSQSGKTLEDGSNEHDALSKEGNWEKE